jgi:hypothetical protein
MFAVVVATFARRFKRNWQRFCRCRAAKKSNPVAVKYWEIIADNLSKAGWSWSCVSVISRVA